MSKKTIWILVAVVGVGVVLLYVSQRPTLGNSGVPLTNTSTLASALGLTSHVLTDVEKAFPSWFSSDTSLSSSDVTTLNNEFGPGNAFSAGA
jgi:hypothetical protein